jgi:hypothetical protein
MVDSIPGDHRLFIAVQAALFEVQRADDIGDRDAGHRVATELFAMAGSTDGVRAMLLRATGFAALTASAAPRPAAWRAILIAGDLYVRADRHSYSWVFWEHVYRRAQELRLADVRLYHPRYEWRREDFPAGGCHV